MRFKGGRLQNGRWLSPRVCGTRRSPKRLLPVLRPQGPEPVRFCVHPARVESISCNLLALPKFCCSLTGCLNVEDAEEVLEDLNNTRWRSPIPNHQGRD